MSILQRHRKVKETALALTIILAPIALLSACSEKAVAPHASTQDIQELPVTEVIKQTLSRVDQLPGEIQAYQDVAIYPKVPGFIDWIGVDRGSKVKKGQVICRLIAPELLAQSNESAAKAKAVSGELQQAQSKLASAKASLLEAKAQRVEREVTASARLLRGALDVELPRGARARRRLRRRRGVDARRRRRRLTAQQLEPQRVATNRR